MAISKIYTAKEWQVVLDASGLKMSVRMIQHYARLELWRLPKGGRGQIKQGRDWLFFHGARVDFPRKTVKNGGFKKKIKKD